MPGYPRRTCERYQRQRIERAAHGRRLVVDELPGRGAALTIRDHHGTPSYNARWCGGVIRLNKHQAALLRADRHSGGEVSGAAMSGKSRAHLLMNPS